MQQFRSVLLQAQSNGTIGQSVVSDVTEVKEVVRVSCPADVTEVVVGQVAAVVLHTGDLTNLGANEIRLLENLFRETYNELTFAGCDPLSRTVAKATLQFDTGQRYNRRQFEFRYDLHLTCRGCHATNITLFDYNNNNHNNNNTSTILNQLTQFGTSGGYLPVTAGHLDKCYCPASFDTARAPTEEEFGLALNATLNRFRTNNGMVTTEINNVLEVQSVDCDKAAPVLPLQSSVLVDLTMNRVNITTDQVALLGETFQKAYNLLNLDLCDPYFRQVTQVQVSIETARLLDDDGNDDAVVVSETFRVRFNVEGQCRGCPSNSTLFDDGIRRVLRDSSSSSVQQDKRRRLADTNTNTSDCFCAVATPRFRSPTEQEFTREFQNRIVQERFMDELPHVVGASNVLEIEQVECADTVSEFESNVYVDFQGDATALLDTERNALEVAFQRTYNRLSESLCDVYFRSLDTVTLVVNSTATTGTPIELDPLSGRNLQSFNSSLLPTLQFLFRIQGRCRGCRRDTFLFDDGARRILAGYTRDRHGISRRRRLQPQQDDGRDCVCPAINPSFRPPTEDEFRVAYNDVVRELREAGTVQSVNIAVEQVTEVERVPCTNEISEFTTSVLVDFDGDPSALTPNQARALEDGFRDTYNELNSGLCDLLFRSVQDVDLVVEETRRRRRRRRRRQLGSSTPRDLQVIPTFNSTVYLPSLVVRFRIRGVCRGCRQDQFLYDEGSRRMLLGSSASPHRALQVSPTDCFCPAFNQVLRGPTQEEMRISYNRTVQGLQREGIIATDSLVVDDVTEVEEVQCSNETNDFETFAFVDWQGDPTRLTDQQVRTLEASFRQTYNTLSSKFCDVEFRRVSSASLELSDVRRRLHAPPRQLQQFNSSLLPTLRFRFRIGGVCRGCKKDAVLFDDGSRRKLAAYHTTSSGGGFVGHRSLQSETSPDCLCPAILPEFRPPTEDEFREAYSESVQDLQQFGLVGDEQLTVEEVKAADEFDCIEEESAFETAVFVELQGDPTNLTTTERRALEVGFQETYNRLSSEFCDVYFRTIDDVAIIAESGRRLVGDTAGSRTLQSIVLNPATTSFNASLLPALVFNFRIRGRCRGCRSDSILFDDGSRRILVDSKGQPFHHQDRRLQDGKCFCPAIQPEYRPPRENEMIELYNATVQNLRREAVLSSVTVCLNLMSLRVRSPCRPLAQSSSWTC